MIEPPDLRLPRPIDLHDGVVSTTRHVWAMLQAADAGDLARVEQLANETPALATCRYDYTGPLHLALLQGHLPVCRFLVDRASVDPGYENHVFRETLPTLAQDRGASEIERLLREAMADPSRIQSRPDTGRIDFGFDEEETEFQRAVDEGAFARVESMLAKRPDLARNDRAFWGEGILAMPAKECDWPLVDLLMRHGASVPDLTKWGARYYFEKTEGLRGLLARGADPNHRSWRGFTLLHDFAFTGDVEKLGILLENGAAIDALDDEYVSTPLGYAAHWGRTDAVDLLLARGADPNRAGAAWASPLAWAIRKGHREIEARLVRAGARS
jgi:ankyrin repeat protein